MNLLLIGMGIMGEEVSRQFIEEWEKCLQQHPDQRPTLTLTFIDIKDAENKAKRLRQWIQENKYPENTVVIMPYQYKIPSAAFLEGEFLKVDTDKGKVPPLSAVIVCLANPTLVITTALEMIRLIEKSRYQSSSPDQKPPKVYMRFIRSDDITRFSHSLKKLADFSNFESYTIVKYGVFWDDRLSELFKEKSCRFHRLCPFGCRKKERDTIK